MSGSKPGEWRRCDQRRGDCFEGGAGDSGRSIGGDSVACRVGGEEQIPTKIRDFHLMACGDGNLVFESMSRRRGHLGRAGQ